jgi:hypothetical protein
LGEITKFIYYSSARRVKEVSIVAAIGLAAGICGKAYNIPQSGLNCYVILVARSAIGKEAMHSGIALILKNMLPSCPQFDKFVEFSKFASGPALVKTVVNNSCFINVWGEFGKALKQMAGAQPNPAMDSLRTTMTDLYQKSGATSIVGGLSYSNKEGNVSSVNGVAYSMIGETTPSVLYESLNEGMMEDGFLSRFIIIEYDGDRPPLSLKDAPSLSPVLKTHLAQLVNHVVDTLDRGDVIYVRRTSEVAEMFAEFEIECDAHINGTVEESIRQVWNRASLKVMRLSALCAVMDNHLQPCIEKSHADWAFQVIRSDIATMLGRMVSGDVGSSDSSRCKKVLSLCRQYLGEPGDSREALLKEKGIIPYRYFQDRTAKLATFSQHRSGAKIVLDSTLASLVDAGRLKPIATVKLMEFIKVPAGKYFAIVDLEEAT